MPVNLRSRRGRPAAAAKKRKPAKADSDFIESDTSSSSSSDEEPTKRRQRGRPRKSEESSESDEEPVERKPRGKPAARAANPSSRLIASLEQMVEAQAKIIALKDDIIAAKTAENERLQRMVRSLELQ